ncbi:MAG: C39 family peptidase [Anaerolineales bacterium]|nr:C39 family peptidase [Anaerolineales bacterium]
MKTRTKRILIGILAAVLAVIGIYFFPPVHARLAWRVENLRTRVIYFFNPPDKALFTPNEESQLDAIVQATMQAYLATPSAAPEPDLPTPVPTITPTPFPDRVVLTDVFYEDQHGRTNYCGPANFSMALRYWGWDGNRDVIGQAVMPGNTKGGLPSNVDKNVMPYEMQEYIADNVPALGSVLRYGGNLDLIKSLIAEGFPVLVEKGIYELDLANRVSWMGHYAFITGYDEAQQIFIYQDSYQPAGAPPGPDRLITFNKMIEGWRAFNYVFVVVYPAEKENEVTALLGPYADARWAASRSLEVAHQESQTLEDIDQYFAYFNIGTAHVELQEYADAAYAYDFAFQIYGDLIVEDSVRPYRMMWYQTGPYKAYYYSGRYSDVINLATTTLKDTISEPVLEESLYWRGQANFMAGQTQAAIDDYRAALKVHPNWIPAIQALQDLGVQP